MERINKAGENIMLIFKNMFLGVWTDIKTGVTNILDSIYTYVTGKLNAIKETLAKMVEVAKQIFGMSNQLAQGGG